MRDRPKALFISPNSAVGQTSPVAPWITAAGWASAIESREGRAWVLTLDGSFQPEDTLQRAVALSEHTVPEQRLRRIPKIVKTLVKDGRTIRRSHGLLEAALSGPWMDSDLDFVWQQNGVFLGAGSEVARQKAVPFVLQMEAPIMWEASRWGVKRPGWGRLVERYGEIPDMMRADVVTCVSEEVAEEVESRGVAPERILVTPCSVDPNRFSPDIDGMRVRDALKIRDRFVVGWVGGFRSFHGIDVLLDAAEEISSRMTDVCLVLVGDGFLRRSVEDDVRRRGLTNVVFAGAVAYADVPEYINAFDAAVVSSPEGVGFHYSPLKLREYMACGRPVIAPHVGHIPNMAADGKEAVLVTPRSSGGLVRAIELLHQDRTLGKRLGLNARRRVEQDGTWNYQVQRLFDVLDDQGGRSRALR